jgi:hypothetical protein
VGGVTVGAAGHGVAELVALPVIALGVGFHRQKKHPVAPHHLAVRMATQADPGVKSLGLSRVGFRYRLDPVQLVAIMTGRRILVAHPDRQSVN